MPPPSCDRFDEVLGSVWSDVDCWCHQVSGGAAGSIARRAASRDASGMSSVPQFAARGITKSFGGRKILRGTDLDVEAGSRIGILGPNGGGKSTLMRILAGIDDAGRRHRDAPARPRARPPAADRRRRRARPARDRPRRPPRARAARGGAAGRRAPPGRPGARLRPGRDDARAGAPRAPARALDRGGRRPRRGRGARSPAGARHRRRQARDCRRASSPAASASSSRSRPASRGAPTSCCSTSPRPTWTCPAASASARCWTSSTAPS